MANIHSYFWNERSTGEQPVKVLTRHYFFGNHLFTLAVTACTSHSLCVNVPLIPSLYTICLSGIRLEFLKPIKDVTVKERETAEFSVELSHEKIPVVWYKNDIRLHPSKVVHMSERGKVHTLAFKEVTIDDTSMIKLEAMGKTSEAMLTVLGQYHFTQGCS